MCDESTDVSISKHIIPFTHVVTSNNSVKLSETWNTGWLSRPLRVLFSLSMGQEFRRLRVIGRLCHHKAEEEQPRDADNTITCFQSALHNIFCTQKFLVEIFKLCHYSSAKQAAFKEMHREQ